MMKRWLTLLAGCTCVLGVTSAEATGTGTGSITNLTSFTFNGVEMFTLTMSSMSSPFAACAHSNRFIISAQDPKFKTVLAMLLGAYYSGSSVIVYGGGTCNTYDGASEDINGACVSTTSC